MLRTAKLNHANGTRVPSPRREPLPAEIAERGIVDHDFIGPVDGGEAAVDQQWRVEGAADGLVGGSGRVGAEVLRIEHVRGPGRDTEPVELARVCDLGKVGQAREVEVLPEPRDIDVGGHRYIRRVSRAEHPGQRRLRAARAFPCREDATAGRADQDREQDNAAPAASEHGRGCK